MREWSIRILVGVCSFLAGWAGTTEVRLHDYDRQQVRLNMQVSQNEARIEQVRTEAKADEGALRNQINNSTKSMDERQLKMADLVIKVLDSNRELLQIIKLQYPQGKP